MMAYLNRAQLTVTPAQLVWRKFPKEMFSPVIYKETVELMDYRNLIKNPKYRPLY